MGEGGVGQQADGAAGELLGGEQVLAVEDDFGQAGVQDAALRVRRNAPFQEPPRFVQPPPVNVQRRQVVERRDVVGVQREGLFVFRLGVGVAPLALQGEAEAGVGVRRTGVKSGAI